MAENYVVLLKSECKAHLNDALIKEVKHKYQIAAIKFNVWHAMLVLLYQEKKMLSIYDNKKVSHLQIDALQAYNEFSALAQNALATYSYPFYKKITPPMLNGNISARDITRLTLVEVFDVASNAIPDTTDIFTAIKTLLTPEGVLTATGVAAINAEVVKLQSTLAKYDIVKSAKANKLNEWLNTKCQWSSWDEVGLTK